MDIKEQNTNIYPVTEENIAKAAELLRHGKTIAFPTETVYGLGANALDPISAAQIFRIKARPEFNPLIVHISDISWLEKYTTPESSLVYELARNFWPGPLTLVVKKQQIIPDIVTAGNSTVAIRMPSHPVALKLISYAGIPVAAPSANKFTRLSPTTANHVFRQLGLEPCMILDGGRTKYGVESTIVKIVDDKLILLREGGITAEDIKLKCGVEVSKPEKVTRIEAPGGLDVHYSPACKMVFADNYDNKKSNIPAAKTGALFFKKPEKQGIFAYEKILSPKGDLLEAAANLFMMLHEFEQENVSLIICERVPDVGIGKAINDRLSRAAQK